jgi:hypothetical protein
MAQQLLTCQIFEDYRLLGPHPQMTELPLEIQVEEKFGCKALLIRLHLFLTLPIHGLILILGPTILLDHTRML